jgi:polysaccharide biosynthesis protein PelB
LIASEATPRLAGWPMLVAFSFVLVSLLALVFPTGREYAALTPETKADAYSIAYLEVLTRANPNELELRIVYAKQLATLGRYDEALAALERVIRDARLGPEARHLALDFRLARARATPEGDPRRDERFRVVHALLGALIAVPRSVPRSIELAELALSLDDPKLAVVYYDDLATRDPPRRAEHLATAGRWLVAAGDNVAAAARYRAAHDAAAEPAKADYAALAVAAIEANDDVRGAADLADVFVSAHPTDPKILALAARLATACGHAAAARAHGRRLLTIRPNDETVLREQTQRELAVTDLRAALELLNRLVARHPNEYALRVQRARVAEWAHDLDTAEKDLLWLVAHRNEAPDAR